MADNAKRLRLRPLSGPTAALLWEQWRIFLPFLGGAVFMAAAGTAGLYVNMHQHRISEADAVFLSDFVRRLCCLALPMLLCASQGGRSVAFPQRLYRLPVTTRRMALYVAVPRLFFLLLTLLILLGFRMLMFGAPDWHTEMLMTVLSVEALVANLAVSWSLGAFRDWAAGLGFMVTVGLSTALYGILGRVEVWNSLNPNLLWLVGGCWAAAWMLVILAGPFRARSGVGLLWRFRRGMRAPVRVQTVSTDPIRLKRFASPFEAQAWYERRTRGYAGLLYPLVFFVLVVLLTLDSRLLDFGGNVPVFTTTLEIAGTAAAICFVVTACRRLVEAHRVRAGRFRFLAAKPISTQELARVRFHTMCRGAETAILFAVAMALFFWLLPPLPLILTPSLWPLWLADAYQSLSATVLTWLLLWVVLLWLFASMTAVSTPNVLTILLIWPLLQLASTYGPVQAIMTNSGDEVVVALTGLCLLVHVVRMFVRARRQRLLSPVSVTLSLITYFALAYLLVQNIVRQVLWDGSGFMRADHMAWTIEIMGVISLAVVPVAALPLQFDRWRHGGK